MLVLSRKKNESIVTDHGIEIKILAIEGEQVKLGIVAPKTVKVYRSELYQAIQQQNKEALNISSELLKELSKKTK